MAAAGVEQKVILVDQNDRQIGIEEKMEAHQHGGKLHRAISIFIFNSNGETMLQQRAMAKYHAGGLWTNTVCSHPAPGETVLAAAHRRLKEEMGFDCDLKETFSFMYRADVGNGLTEHEFDHVFFGAYDDDPVPNPAEADGWKWIGLDELRAGIAKDPQSYTPWLRIAIDRVIAMRGKK